MAAKVQSGHVDIPLVSGLTIDGAKTMTLRMREPTVADQLATDNAQGGDAAKEMAMMANLLMITPEDIKALTLRDYKKVQTAFLAFID